MRYPASEKLEIIRLVEQSHLGVGSTLDKLGNPKCPSGDFMSRMNRLSGGPS